MEVVAFDAWVWLLETDVVEAGEGGAVDVLDGVIWHEKVLFPAHENEVCLFQRIIVEVVGVERLAVLVECNELTLKYKRDKTINTGIPKLWIHDMPYFNYHLFTTRTQARSHLIYIIQILRLLGSYERLQSGQILSFFNDLFGHDTITKNKKKSWRTLKRAYYLIIFPYPVFFVNVFICIPLSGQKWMFFADNFSVEERG